MNRKKDLQSFLDTVPSNHFVGLYYKDLNLNISHYSIYKYSDISILREKLEKFNSDLDDGLIRVLLWKSAETEEYLTGVYDGVTASDDNTGFVK